MSVVIRIDGWVCVSVFAFYLRLAIAPSESRQLCQFFDINSVGPTGAHMQIFDPIPFLFPIRSWAQCVCQSYASLNVWFKLPCIWTQSRIEFNDFSFLCCVVLVPEIAFFSSAVECWMSCKFGMVNANQSDALTNNANVEWRSLFALQNIKKNVLTAQFIELILMERVAQFFLLCFIFC